jgi:hypothetical protein
MTNFNIDISVFEGLGTILLPFHAPNTRLLIMSDPSLKLVVSHGVRLTELVIQFIVGG